MDITVIGGRYGLASPEFKGLKSQYLFIFAGGLLALFVLFVVMYMAGIDQWVCIGFGVICASVLVWVTFRLNTKYGEWLCSLPSCTASTSTWDTTSPSPSPHRWVRSDRPVSPALRSW